MTVVAQALRLKLLLPTVSRTLTDYGADLSFCLEAFDETDLRQQNFYSSDQFEALSGPMLITEVALRITRITGPPPIDRSYYLSSESNLRCRVSTLNNSRW